MSKFEYIKLSSLISEKPRNGLYKKKDFQGKGHRWIKMNEVYGNNFLLDQETELLDVSESEISRFNCQPGDLLFGRTSLTLDGIGDCLLVGDVKDVPIFESNLFRIRFDKDKAYSLFYYYFFKSNAGKVLIQSIAKQTAATSITSTDFVTLSVPYAPIAKQREIADKLFILDEKCVNNTQTNQTLEEMAQAIFKSWFVDFDPVKAKMRGEHPEVMDADTASLFPDKLVESELGMIPEGWEVTDIDNATSKVFSGGTPSTKNESFWGGELPWFSSGETRNNFIIETEKHITQEGVDDSSTKAATYGDVLIASAGQGHTRGQTSFNSIDCYINQSVVALRASDSVSPYWLYYCLERRYDEMRSVSDSHSSRGSLTTKLLKALPIAKPSKYIVNAFDAIVESLVRKQVANAKQNKELSLLRDTLLPKLLSGEIDLGA